VCGGVVARRDAIILHPSQFDICRGVGPSDYGLVVAMAVAVPSRCDLAILSTRSHTRHSEPLGMERETRRRSGERLTVLLFISPPRAPVECGTLAR
jgi:hypothetical protein